MRRLAVAPGAARLLKKVFERAGMSAWTTRRTSGLSMPMPKALVAAIARNSPPMKRRCTSFLVSGGTPA